MNEHLHRRGRRAAVGLVTVLMGAALAAAPAKAALAECPTIMPVDNVTDGMVGTGYTVDEGSTPEAFTVEVLGVLQDGIGPGRDMIVVEARSEAITRAGGIWAGMSGSPVYVNGQLIGAVAYGLSWGPSNIGGLTPAEDMLRIAERPTETEAQTMPRRVSLSDRLVRSIAAEADVSTSEVSSNMRRIMTPVGISGVNNRVMRQIEKTIEHEELPLIPYMGSGSSVAQQQTPATPEAGGNFSAVISYGDITFAGIGTTTYVCEGKVLAFGHPFFYFPSGKTTLGANDASAITVVPDPTFVPYKLANVTGTFGTLDQDRFAGVRALLGEGPASAPITTSVTADGQMRDGQTDVVEDEYVPFLAFIHILSNVDFTWDQIGEGSSDMSYTINGVTDSGTPFSLDRSNMFASDWDIAYMSIWELESFLYTLYANEFEEISFTGIDSDVSVDEEVRQYTIAGVLVSTDGVNYKDRRRVRIAKGGTVYLRVSLEPYEGTEVVTRDFVVEIPKNVRYEARIELRGGQNSFWEEEFFCFTEYAECAGNTSDKIESFEDLVAALENAPKNNDLLMRLYGTRRQRDKQVQTMDQVVTGRKRIRVLIGEGYSSGGGEGEIIEGK